MKNIWEMSMRIEDIKGSTILVVDDNPTNLNVLSDYFIDLGFTVLLKKSGESAIELLTRIEVVDIILLDILMPPGIDGFETCRRLKENDNTKHIPVIFLSALSDLVDKVKGFELGAVDYITKPFQHEEVLARVKAHLTIQKLQRELNEALVIRSERQMEELRMNISSSVPHELRTPLTSILGYSDYIIKRHEKMDKDKIVGWVRSINESASRLHKLIHNYMMYAQLEIIATDPNRISKVRAIHLPNPNNIIAFAAKQQAMQIKREADLFLELGGESTVQISADNLEKIMEEVMDNAFKFSEEETPVYVETVLNNNLFMIKISDNGRGMASDNLGSIGAYMQFERRLHEQKGAGLGLIIAKRLVEIHGGTIEIISQIDKGTTVKIAIPIIN